MRTVTNKRIPITNMPGKICFIDKSFKQFDSKDKKQIMLVNREEIRPGIVYEKPIQHSYWVGDSKNGDLESVESLSEAMAVAWLLSNNYTYSDFK
jgi:hypothetical protein